MIYTVAETIQIAKISQYLSSNDIYKKGLYGGGTDIQLPRKIYMVRKNVEWLYLLDPSDDTLPAMADFLYALCGMWGQQALNEIGSGGAVSPVSPTTVPDPYDFIVDASSFIVTGARTKTIDAFIGYNLLFIRNNIPQSQSNVGASYFSWDRDTGDFETFDPSNPGVNGAAQAGEVYQLYPFL